MRGEGKGEEGRRREGGVERRGEKRWEKRGKEGDEREKEEGGGEKKIDGKMEEKKKERGGREEIRGESKRRRSGVTKCVLSFSPLGSSPQIAAIPAVFHVGPLQLATGPVKNSLRALPGA